MTLQSSPNSTPRCLRTWRRCCRPICRGCSRRSSRWTSGRLQGSRTPSTRRATTGKSRRRRRRSGTRTLCAWGPSTESSRAQRPSLPWPRRSSTRRSCARCGPLPIATKTGT
eukprot:Amastigsp_a2363_36.p5 type:complete len:112 gc:universal Amastigsp_a2363_36:500-165(-)